MSYYEAGIGSTPSRRKKKNEKDALQKEILKREIPLEERLKDLLATTSASSADGPSKETSIAKAEELIITLVKGLHASDAKLIEEVLSESNQDLIKTCVRRLPVQSLLPLLQELARRIRSKSDVRSYIRWLHIVLSTHMAYLSSAPEIVDILDSHHKLLEARVCVMDRFRRLQGRLGLILDQFADKRQPQDHRDLSQQAAKAVFVEESVSDDELDMSPAEDQGDTVINWDDLKWSDEEEESDNAEKDSDIDQDEAQSEESGGDNDKKSYHLVNGHTDGDDEDEDEDEDPDDSENEFAVSSSKRKRIHEDEVDDAMEFS